MIDHLFKEAAGATGASLSDLAVVIFPGLLGWLSKGLIWSPRDLQVDMNAKPG
jgi:hypothetical protein